MADRSNTEEYWVSLNRRVEVLEKRLLGRGGQREGQPPLTVSVGQLNAKLASLGGGGSVETAWRNITELERVLRPEYAIQLATPASSKAELVLAQAERLKPLCAKAEELLKLKDYLQVTEFQGLGGQEKRLCSLAHTHSQQEGEVERLSHAVLDAMHTYQHVTLQLSAKCIEWNETLDKFDTSK